MQEQLNRSTALKSQVTTRKTEFLFSQALPLMAGNLLASLLIAILYWQMLDHGVLLAWLAASLVVLGSRLRLSYKFKARNRYDDTNGWLSAYSVNLAINGCLWGALFVYAGLNLDTDALFFFPFILGALLSGTCIAYNSYLRSYLYFAIPSTLPAAIVLIIAGEDKAYIGIITLCWFAYLLTIAIGFNKHLSKTTRHEFENIELLNEIKRVDEQNTMLKEELVIKNQVLDHLANHTTVSGKTKGKPTAISKQALR